MGRARGAKSAPVAKRGVMRRALDILFIAGALGLAVAACIPGRSGGDGEQAETTVAPAGEQVEAPAQAADGTLVTDFESDTVVCDGTNRQLGEVRGALPGERILFSSPTPVTLPEVSADQSGRFNMAWNCDPSEARLRWEIRAVGHDSNRSVVFTIVGTEVDPLTDGLVVDVINAPFTCDGFTKKIGTITGAFPSEEIIFTSPESSNLRPGKANVDGALDINWSCESIDDGKTWNVTATGADSGRVGVFAIAGTAPEPLTTEPLEAAITEEPFLCNGETRQFGTLSNFAPSEVVDFSSPQSSNLIDGRADSTGVLPVRWQCNAADAGKVWELTAVGVSSQRTITLTITGAAPSTELTVSMSENPFACDGESRIFATITNLAAREFVDFASPQSGPLRQGQADGDGVLPVRWQCGAGDIDKVWDITATGTASGASVTFQVTGAAPANG